MSVDLTCPECNGSGRRPTRMRPHNRCFTCKGEGRRRPELYEYDALKTELADAEADAQAWWDALQDERNWLCQQVMKLEAERDQLRDPIDLTAVYGTIDCDWPVPRCLGVAGWLRWHDEHGWLSVCGRHVRDDLDPKGGETL